MSFFGVMGTAISGMNAQTNKLSSVGDNIANANTNGYKRADTEFATLLGSNVIGSYSPGGVDTTVRYNVSDQGQIQTTSTVTNVAVKGNGFFVVDTPTGTSAMSRAGAFVPDANGNLVNVGGNYLMGYDLQANPNQVGGIGALVKVNIPQTQLKAIPSTAGTLAVNVDSRATSVAAGNLPSVNATTAAYTSKTSLVAYDDLGAPVNLDVYMTKTATSNTWEVTVFNQAGATNGGFPYTGTPLPLATTNVTFDPTTGALTAASAKSLSVAIPNGNAITMDLSKMTQLATGYTVTKATIDGSAPSPLDHIEIAQDGTVSEVFSSGARLDTYKIPLATVASPDSLTQITGNAYVSNAQSGNLQLGAAGSSGFGSISSSSVESSDVDLATELSNMIVAQRGYEANSKVLQTGAELLHVITQLQT